MDSDEKTRHSSQCCGSYCSAIKFVTQSKRARSHQLHVSQNDSRSILFSFIGKEPYVYPIHVLLQFLLTCTIIFDRSRDLILINNACKIKFRSLLVRVHHPYPMHIDKSWYSVACARLPTRRYSVACARLPTSCKRQHTT